MKVEELSQKNKVTIMIALMAAMGFASINQTIVSTAMPRIIAILGGIELYTWVITIYMLTSTIVTVIVGKLSDMYGRKPFLLIGIVIFSIGAFLAGTSGNIYQMITYRGIQGVGGGVIMSATITAVGDLFAPRERAKWTGVIMAVFGFASVLGPTLGGFLVDHMPWHWLFWIFLPLGFVAFFMIWRMFPGSTHQRVAQKIDYAGLSLLSVSLVALLLGFSWAGTKYAWGSAEILGLFAISLVLLVIFLFVERRAVNPVMPLSLFKNGVINIANSAGFLMNAAMMGAMMYLPFFVQGVKGISPTASGFINMPMSLAMMLLSTLTGRWITKSGKYKRYALIGMPFMIGGMLIMSVMNSVALAVVSMIVFGIGLGLAMPVFTLAVQNAVQPNILGVATATSTLFRNLGGTIGIAVMGTLMNSTLTSKLTAAMTSPGAPDLSVLPPEKAVEFGKLLNPQLLLNQPKLKEIIAGLPEQLLPLFNQMMDMLRNALGETISVVFLFGSLTLVVALVLVSFLKELPLRTAEAQAKSRAAQAEAEARVEQRVVAGEGNLS